MKRALGATAVVLALLVAGCSSSDSSGSDADASSDGASQETTTTEATTYTTAELTPMLLTVSDLPSGWSVDNSPSSDDDDTSTPKCFQDLDTVGDDDPSTEAEISFEMGTAGIPALSESLSGGFSAEEFEAGSTILDGCSDVSFDSGDGQHYEGTIGALSIDPIGDESAAWRMSFEVQGIPFTFEIAVVRVGSIGVLVAVADLGGVAEGVLDTMTAKAVAKVETTV